MKTIKLYYSEVLCKYAINAFQSFDTENTILNKVNTQLIAAARVCTETKRTNGSPTKRGF